MTRTRRLRRLASALLLGIALMFLPDAGPAPTRLSLIKAEGAQAVDFQDGVVWFLLLGSDARPGDDMFGGNADAIELVAVNLEAGSAVAIGIPRDSWVRFDDGEFHKLNAALPLGDGSTALMVEEVKDITGVTPDFVAVTDLSGFAGLVDSIHGVSVRSAFDFEDIDIQQGLNPQIDGAQATEFARSRNIPGDDLARVAHQQALLRGILQRIQQREDRVDFIEDGVVAALRFLDTDLGPAELYRLAQAISGVDLKRFANCVIGGRFGIAEGLSVIYIDERQAERVAQDAANDAMLQGGC